VNAPLPIPQPTRDELTDHDDDVMSAVLDGIVRPEYRRRIQPGQEHRVGPGPIVTAPQAAALKVPFKTKDVKPTYPAKSLSAGDEGVVTVELNVGPSGSVTDARVDFVDVSSSERGGADGRAELAIRDSQS
jgi:TonB family protein